VCAQATASSFYSTYDARELVKKRKYKSLDFDRGEGGDEFKVEDEDAGIDKIRSNSYGCSIQTTGDDPFNLGEFLKWLARETIDQIESQKGEALKQNHRIGRRFYIDYAQSGFTGRIEVYADLEGTDHMSLDVEIMESSKK
jgi:hypothetical protein